MDYTFTHRISKKVGVTGLHNKKHCIFDVILRKGNSTRIVYSLLTRNLTIHDIHVELSKLK